MRPSYIMAFIGLLKYTAEKILEMDKMINGESSICPSAWDLNSLLGT